jgi:hypothetical protein
MKKQILILLGLLLAACGGSSTSESRIVAPALSLSEGQPPAMFSLSRISDGVILAVPPSSTALEYEITTIADEVENIGSYQSAFGGESYILFGESSSGAGQFFVSPIDINISRLTETEISTSGTATYEGSYASLLIDPLSSAVQSHIFADAELNIDFGNSTLDGAITNRRELGPVVISDDIILEETSFDNGGASGIASGGGFIGFNSDGGGFTTMIVGDNGQEAIGVVLLEHLYPSTGQTVYLEYGGFVVN